MFIIYPYCYSFSFTWHILEFSLIFQLFFNYPNFYKNTDITKITQNNVKFQSFLNYLYISICSQIIQYFIKLWKFCKIIQNCRLRHTFIKKSLKIDIFSIGFFLYTYFSIHRIQMMGKIKNHKATKRKNKLKVIDWIYIN